MQNYERKAWGRPESSGCIFRRVERERSYPSKESEKYHRDVERRHDEEIENTVLENRSHQPVHVRPAVTSFELKNKKDHANKSNEVYRGCELP